MRSDLETEITASMEVDGVHIHVDGELKLIVDNDPYDLLIRTPADDSYAGRLMFSLSDAVEEVFGAVSRQEHLGLVATLAITTFSMFEEQEKFTNQLSQ
jgi:hypothetical protein